jgi:hypothetical protein
VVKGENIANILREIVANREQDRTKKPTLNWIRATPWQA